MNAQATHTKATRKAVKQATKATKAKPNPYRVDEAGYPSPVEIKDVPLQSGIWGEVSGRALVVDLFNWREVLTEQQANDNVTDEIRHLMEEAVKVLETPYVDGFLDRRDVAIGVLEGFADLVAYALESKAVREYMVQNLSNTVQTFNELEAAELVRARTLALDVHGLAREKGGAA